MADDTPQSREQQPQVLNLNLMRALDEVGAGIAAVRFDSDEEGEGDVSYSTHDDGSSVPFSEDGTASESWLTDDGAPESPRSHASSLFADDYDGGSGVGVGVGVGIAGVAGVGMAHGAGVGAAAVSLSDAGAGALGGGGSSSFRPSLLLRPTRTTLQRPSGGSGYAYGTGGARAQGATTQSRNAAMRAGATASTLRSFGRRKRRRWLNDNLFGVRMATISEHGGDDVPEEFKRPGYPSDSRSMLSELMTPENRDTADSFRRGAYGPPAKPRRRAAASTNDPYDLWKRVDRKIRPQLLNTYRRDIAASAAVLSADGLHHSGVAGAGAPAIATRTDAKIASMEASTDGTSAPCVASASYFEGLEALLLHFIEMEDIAAPRTWEGAFKDSLAGHAPLVEPSPTSTRLLIPCSNSMRRMMIHGACQFYGLQSSSKVDRVLGTKVLAISPTGATCKQRVSLVSHLEHLAAGNFHRPEPATSAVSDCAA